MSPEMYVVVSLDLMKRGPYIGKTIPVFTECSPGLFDNLADAIEARDEAPGSSEFNDTDPRVYRLVDVDQADTGLLARLSASGGRNIDLLKRAQDSEAAAAGVRELHRPVWHAWTELDGTPGEGWICGHCTPTGRVTKLTHHPCSTINVLDGSGA